jgi:putative transposase
MLNGISKKFPDSARKRCVVYKMDNIRRYILTKQQQLKPELKALFYQKGRQAADQAVAAFIERYRSVYPTTIACLPRDLVACLTFYAFPKEHWRSTPTISWSDSLGKSSGTPIKWWLLSTPKRVVYCCSMPSFVVCILTS